MAFDILSNHKICNMRTVADQTTGTANQTAVDLQEEVTTFLNQRERTSRGLLIIAVTSVGAGGTLDLIVMDSNDNITYDTDFATLTQIDAVGLYVADIKDTQRYLMLRATAGTDTVAWGAVFIGFDAQRRPVQQSDATELTVTKGSGR